MQRVAERKKTELYKAIDVKNIFEGKKQVILIDFGKKLNGHLHLEFEWRNDNGYGQINDKRVTYKYGPRADFLKFSSELQVLSSGNQLICRDNALCSLQYVQMEIPEDWGREALDWTLESVGLELKMRSVERLGSFECSDELITKIWEAGVNTIHLCIYPHHQAYSCKHRLSEERMNFIRPWKGKDSDYVLMDGPRRDREVWVGDLLPEVRTCWFAFRDREVIRNSLKVIVDQQLENGFIPASSVSFQNFSEYCCWFVLVLYEYVLYSGDMEFLKEIWNNYRDVMKWIEQLRDEEGMIKLQLMQTWAWTLARKGYVTSTQCVLCDSYRCAAELENWMGFDTESKKFKAIAEVLRNRIREKGLSREQVFKDISEDMEDYNVSLDANAYSILFGIAEDHEADKILDFIQENMWEAFGTRLLYRPEEDNGRNWPHNIHIWPFGVSFEVEARFKRRKTDTAMELLRRCWGNMLAHGSSTFWEIIDGCTGDFMNRRIHEPGDDVDTWNSYCHGWSAGVSYVLQAYVAGIRPVEPGFEIFEIDPQPAGLEKIHACIPISGGQIKICLHRMQDGCVYQGTIEVPENTTGVWKDNKPEYFVHVSGCKADENGNFILPQGYYEFTMKERG